MATVALDADVLIAFRDASDAQHHIDLRPRLTAGVPFLLAAPCTPRSSCVHYNAATMTSSMRSSPRSARGSCRSIATSRDALPGCTARTVLRLPDALSLATALITAPSFLTLDRRLGKIAEDERTHG